MNENKALLFTLSCCGLVIALAFAMDGAQAPTGARRTAGPANDKTEAGNLLRKLDLIEKGMAASLAAREYDGEHEVTAAMRELRSCIQAAREAARELLADDWNRGRQSIARLDILDAAVQRANEQFKQACSRYLRSPRAHVGHGWADDGVPGNVAETLAARLARKFRTTESDITAKTLKTQELLAAKGVRMTPLEIMAGLDSCVDGGNSLGVRYEEVAALFVSICGAMDER